MRYIRTLGGIEHMLSVEGGDQQDRILGTTHALVTRLADTLSPRVLLDSPAERITTTDEGVSVETRGQRIDARFAIITASPMHRASIKFNPALPEQHYGLARSWRLGALSKAFVAYDRPFWRDHGLSGEAMSDDETVFLTFDTSPTAAGPGILMVFCDARGFDAWGRSERQQRVVRHLVHLFAVQVNRPVTTSTTPTSPGATTPSPPAAPIPPSPRRPGPRSVLSCANPSVLSTGPAPRPPMKPPGP
jgi:monoamine oxidase